MGSTEEHQQLVDDILLDVGSLPDVRLWIRVVGFDFEKNINYGIPGEADLQGIIAPTGRHLHIECKTGNATQSKAQIKRNDMMRSFGAIVIEGRDRFEVLKQVERWVEVEKRKLAFLTAHRDQYLL